MCTSSPSDCHLSQLKDIAVKKSTLLSSTAQYKLYAATKMIFRQNATNGNKHPSQLWKAELR